MNKILIISSEYTGHGHKSVHTAMVQGFEKFYKGKIECKVINGFELADKKISSLEKLYNPYVKYFPDMWATLFLLSDKNVNFLGIAISSKICKATKRNYIKRIIRENYKNMEEHLKTGYSIVFLWKRT